MHLISNNKEMEQIKKKKKPQLHNPQFSFVTFTL